MSALMEQHARWSAARERLWKPTRRDIRAMLATLPPTPPRIEEPKWGCPINFLTHASPRFLIKLVAVRRGIEPTEMLSRVKTRALVEARDEAVALIYTHCRKMSLPDMGRLFGDRDHTTILHSLRKMRRKGQPVYRVSPTINNGAQGDRGKLLPSLHAEAEQAQTA